MTQFYFFWKISFKDPMTGMTIEDFETEFKPQHKIGGLVIIISVSQKKEFYFNYL